MKEGDYIEGPPELIIEIAASSTSAILQQGLATPEHANFVEQLKSYAQEINQPGMAIFWI